MRKAWLVLLVLTLALGGACALAQEDAPTSRVFAVDMQGSSILIDTDGNVRTQPGEYAGIYKVTSTDCPAGRELFAASQMPPDEGEELTEDSVSEEDSSYLCALMDANGTLLTEFAYSYFTHYPELGVVVFCDQNSLCGVMDEAGNVLIAADYGALVPNMEGSYLGTPADTFRTDEEEGYALFANLACIAADGTRTDTGLVVQPYYLAGYSEGLMPVYMLNGEIWQYGYVDVNGALAIGEYFETADRFLNGYAAVCALEGGYGLIRRDGSYAIEPEYVSLEYGWTGGDTFVAQRDENTVHFIRRDTLEIAGSYVGNGDTGISCYSMNPGVFYLSDGDKVSVCAGDGEILYTIENANQAYIYGTSDNQNGTSDRLMLCEGEWPNTECYLISLTGEKIAGPYPELSLVSSEEGEARYAPATFEIAQVEMDGASYPELLPDSSRYGLIDANGAEILPVEYQQIWHLEGDRYWAEKDGVFGIIDEAGNWVARVEG